MKRKFYKLLGVGLALVLVVSFSLVPAAVMGQTSSYAGYTLGKTDANTAAWDKDQKEVDNYSVKLDWNGGSTAYVEFVPQTGITMDDLDSIVEEWSYWYHMVTLTTGGPNMELQFTSADYPTTDFGHAEVNVQVEVNFDADVWAEEDAVTNGTVYTYCYDPVDGTESVVGLSPGPFFTLGTTLAAIDATTEMTTHSASAATWELTRVRMEIGWGGDTRTCYIDDVTIDGVTYAIEPMVLDAEYYSIGETVDVTLCNGDASANTDPMAIDEITIKAKSDTDTVGDDSVTLTETGSDTGVFTGAITLLGAPPADREADEIVVSAEDTVTVYYSGDWGDGAQILDFTDPPSAIVDDTAPVITIVEPLESANITDTTPLIQADFTEDGSGIDTDSVVMTFDGSAVTPDTATSTETTYTPGEALDDGSYTVTVDVDDLAGNAATQLSWSFTVDNVAPVITLQESTPPVILPDDETEVTFSATVIDATSGVASVEIDLSGVGGTADLAMHDDGVAPDATADDGIYTASENITESSEANYNLTVTATDESGNSDTADITLGVWTDIVAPVIADPAITYTYGSSVPPGGTVTISANVTDNILMDSVLVTADTDPEFTATLLDDGNAPDETASDDIYTGEGTVDSGVGLGEYTITITATDAKGNPTTDETLILDVDPSPTGVPIELAEGWNLMSLPLIPDDADIAAVISIDTLASGNVSSVGIVWGYDPATEEFAYYMPETGSDGLTEMSDGNGYWIFMESADTLTVTGMQWPVPPEVPPTYDVVVDWNLIGFKSLVDMIDYEAGTPDTGYLLNIDGTYPVLWSYDAVSGVYENVKGVTNGMEVGHGFWIWITEAGTIVPPG